MASEIFNFCDGCRKNSPDYDGNRIDHDWFTVEVSRTVWVFGIIPVVRRCKFLLCPDCMGQSDENKEPVKKWLSRLIVPIRRWMDSDVISRNTKD